MRSTMSLSSFPSVAFEAVGTRLVSLTWERRKESVKLLPEAGEITTCNDFDPAWAQVIVVLFHCLTLCVCAVSYTHLTLPTIDDV